MAIKQKDEETPAQKAAARKEELKENIIAIGIVVLLSLAAGWWVYAQLNPAAPAASDEPRQSIFIGASPSIGNDSAHVTVVEFSDFECPFCGEFARDQFPIIKAQYIDTGKVRFVFKQFPLPSHPDAELAAETAVCAQDQGKFWEYHDLLYAHQDKLGKSDLLGYAAQLGLDSSTFADCANGLRATDVLADRTAGEKAGVAGTPTFFFNGRKVVGAITAEQFGREVAAEMQ